MRAFPSLNWARGFGLAAVLAFALTASAQEPAAEKAEKPQFAKGETVEVWWAGAYLPGEIVALEENGWVRVKFTQNGREQTIKQPGDGQWVRKLKAPPAEKAAAPGAKPAGEPANPFAVAEQAAVRTWTDSTGKFKIEASFAGKEGDDVLLTKTDGKTIKLPLAKLSKEDQDHIAGLNVKPPMEKNPFDAAEQVAEDGLDRVADWSGAEQILPQPIDGWPLAPDAAQQPAEALAGKAISLPGGGRERFFESPTSLLFNAAASEAVVIFINGPPGKDREARLVRCDLKTGRISGDIQWTTSFKPVDVSPSGSLVACLPDQFAKNASEKNKIAILRREGDRLTPVVRWNMGEGTEFAKKFDQLYFLGEDKVLCCATFGGAVTLMQIEPVRALWTLKTAQNTTAALSANRNQLAAAVDGGIGIFSTSSGETLARISTDRPAGPTFSFSPDGKRLANLAGDVLLVYDLNTGKPIHEVWFPKHMAGKSLDWCGGNFVLVDGAHLIDLEKRVVLWKYDTPGVHKPLGGQFGGRLWLVSGGHNEPCQLLCPTLPEPAAKAKGDQLTADGVLALKPGSQVSLQVNLPAHAADVQKVTQALTDSLTNQGFTVAAGAPISLEATIADSGKESVSYRGFGRLGGSDKVEVQKFTSSVTMKENGKEIWTASFHYGAPRLVHLKEGQKIEDAINEQRGNPVDFFSNIRLPRYMARHEADGAYGTSKLAP